VALGRSRASEWFGLSTWPSGPRWAWPRLAVGHRYASDAAAGTILGALVSGLLTYWIAS